MIGEGGVGEAERRAYWIMHWDLDNRKEMELLQGRGVDKRVCNKLCTRYLLLLVTKNVRSPEDDAGILWPGMPNH